MDLFELLFIALFIIFPIMEGILKQRRKGKGQTPTSGEEADAEWSPEGEEPRSAADMVPDDLWEIMTGEQRPTEGRPDDDSTEEPWSSAPGGAPTYTPAPEPEPEPDLEPVSEDWRSEPWVMDDEAEVPEPESLEYEGPEAYSLETPAPEPITRRAPSAEARHRAFHDLVDRPRPKKKRRLSPLMKALRSPDGLRQAVLLKEVLGPPKGLE